MQMTQTNRMKKRRAMLLLLHTPCFRMDKLKHGNMALYSLLSFYNAKIVFFSLIFIS